MKLLLTVAIRLGFIVGLFILGFGFYIGYTEEVNSMSITSFFICLWFGTSLILNMTKAHSKQ